MLNIKMDLRIRESLSEEVTSVRNITQGKEHSRQERVHKKPKDGSGVSKS